MFYASFPTFARESFETKLVNLNEKLAKAGCTTPVKILKESPCHLLLDSFPVHGTTVQLSSPTKETSGSFVGHVDFTEETTIYHSCSNYNLTHIKNNHKCDHCNSNRKRNQFFVYLDNEGNEKVLGSSCVDFVFGKGYLKYFKMFKSFIDKTAEDTPASYANSYQGKHINEVLEAGLTAYDMDSKYHKHYTASLMSRFLFSLAKGSVVKQPESRLESVKRKLIETFKDINTSESNFNKNCFNTLFYDNGELKDMIARKTIPLFTFCLFSALNGKAIKERSPKLDSNHVGRKFDSIDVKGLVTYTKECHSHYGSSMLVMMEDSKGNIFKFFSSAKFCYDLKKNDTIEIRAVVKDHEIFKGIKSTMLKAPKLVSRQIAETVS